MYQAILDMMEDSKQEGRAEGRVEGKAAEIVQITENIMKQLRCSLEKACEVTGKTLSEYQQAKAVYAKANPPGISR